VYLSPEERRQAAALSGALSLARDMVAAGERDPGNIVRAVRAHIEERAPLARVDYVAVADPVSMQPLQQPISSEALVALAAFFGSTRLIDNIVVGRDGDALCA
jgi:pantoate--beta-alanine ligase